MHPVRLWNRVRPDDLDDPYLRTILACSLILSGFWLWYRTPNFVGADEYSRLIRPMKVAGWTLSDPGIGSLQQGFLDGRALGASTYLYGLVLVPIGLYVVLTGQLDTFTGLGEFESRWTLWFVTPEWFWTASILFARLIVLSLALGCVYLTYVLGRRIADRTAGRLAALFLALSLGFVGTAHEAGEDVPMLFLLLLSLLYVLRYLEDGQRRTLIVASGLGGLAIAFKLTAGVIVFAISLALFAKFREGDASPDVLVKQAVIGALVGFGVIIVGMPSVLFGGLDELFIRVTGAGTEKIVKSRSESILLWIPRQYVNGLGLPLFVASAIGITTSARRIPENVSDGNYERGIVAVMLVVYLLVFLQWGYIRVHHLLPTFPLLFLLLASEISLRWERPDVDVLSALLVFLVVSTALFAAVGTFHYANEPRDKATDWLSENAAENAAVEVYDNSVADVGVPHDIQVSRYDYNEDTQSYSGDSLVANESAYTEWMTSMPERAPEYIQLTSTQLDSVDADNSKYPKRQAYIRRLLAGEYNYEKVAEFGPGHTGGSGFGWLVREGLNPVPESVEPRVVILKRTGE